MRSRIKKIVSSPIFQSLIIGFLVSLLVYIIWDTPITKFNVDVEPFENRSGENRYWFAGDFNNDGSSERIRCHHGLGSKSMDLVHFDEQGNLTGHYHFFESEWSFALRPDIFDIDEDGTKELLFFTTRNDSIFFNAFNLARFELQIDHHYFYTFERKRNDYACNNYFRKFGDFNKDGVNELFFSFDAGFGLYPRGVFKMEFPSLKTTVSPTEYMVINPLYFTDINRDSIPEIFCGSTAPSNVSTYKNYTDSISYSVVLDYDLNLVFDPIPFEGEFTSAQVIPDQNNKTVLYSINYSRSKSKDPFKVQVLNTDGAIINEKKWASVENPEQLYRSLEIINNQSYLLIKDIGGFRLTPSLENLPISLEYGQNDLGVIPLLYDLNGDGWDEWISASSKDEIAIYNERKNEKLEFSSPLTVNYAFLKIFPFYVDHKLTKYVFSTGSGFFFFTYEKNPYYFILYLIYFGILLLTSAIVYTTLYLQRKNLEQKWRTEKQLSELQFNAVKNQLNPHFLFNSLNSVAYLINEGKKSEAYDFLSLNSRMIQRVMDDAKEVKRPLKDEIQFSKDYLNIQEHRFKGKFECKFTIHSEADKSFEVPKMCIHTYVENAVKHGFRNTKDGGKLDVNVLPLKNGVQISISDNGMGRKDASKYDDSSGNGMKIMEELFTLFERYYGYSIKTNIKDYDEGTDGRSGLSVTLEIKNKVKNYSPIE